MTPVVHTYRYGDTSYRPGLKLGVTRHPPRGVPRSEYESRGYFQVWLPLLGPSAALLAALRTEAITFPVFARRYRSEMKQSAPRQVIRLLAHLAPHQPIHLGCYCADASRCHRSVLAALIAAEAGAIDATDSPSSGFASPACGMPEIED